MNAPHRRRNPLRGDYILVSPHRGLRPWQGAHEPTPSEHLPAHDPQCYLCPGNTRANGMVNPNYKNTFVFINDFSALLPNDEIPVSIHPLLKAEPASGECRVICFSPQHNLTLANMALEGIENVIALWREQLNELSQKYTWVQIFENKGAIMGCSNPHPHGQIWASDFLPNEIKLEDENQARYFEEHKTALLVDYANLESQQKERIVLENTDWIVVVPFWATWPFETLILPKRPVQQLTELTADEQKSLATILQSLLRCYDKLFNVSFPYSMGWHGAPFNKKNNTHWQLHAHIYPPLLRSATVKKFMVGYELLAEIQRDITPEQAAERLRAVC
jgi:UDPglucose--hexose-1-phosphate uridylyltransferase